MTHKEVIGFITEHIIHRFGIPQTLPRIKVLHLWLKRCVIFLIPMVLSCSIHLYIMVKANGQAECNTKTLIKLIKTKIEDNPKRLHEVLSEALWAHRISRHCATKVTLFELAYGQEVVLPVEFSVSRGSVPRSPRRA
jgi:hypothetical protein